MHANNTAEIIPNRLYWISDRMPPSRKENLFYFCTDSQYIYHPYSSDFGPLDLGKVYRYIVELNSILSNPKLQDCVIYHYTSMHPSRRANSALLMGTFQILMLGKTPDEACSAFEHVEAFIPFVDASYQPSSFELYIEDCLKGFEKAIKLGWFNLGAFNLKEYEQLSAVEHGGLNWIVPDKLLAFVCPASERSAKYPAFTPEMYVSLFRNLGVTDIIRLNNKTYEAERFLRYGFNHRDLYFLDGSVPSEEIVEEFIELVDKVPGAIAVHCKAGLGRTATLIGCYAIKYYGFTGLEFIGWARLCRPGSVLGPQQQFLCDRYEIMNGRVPKALTSDDEKYKAKFGDYGQSGRLMAKTNTSSPILSSRTFLKKATMTNTAKMLSMKTLTCRKK
ncbi:hypothetical protein SteCoe_32860 [Stentor coeruleus]|uniref:protein-tyrosine-phosphatase n=1 Tax=Stentor coeruleus TaxID=5963 RepID=A0A1R2AY34_9CILI|nr:hypothetical protein SteCoe_32860 [Stentor coeruleus]